MRHAGVVDLPAYGGAPAGEPAPGRLLVATPLLGEPFRRAVILLLEHDESGTLGVVLNQPTTVEVGSVLPQWRDHLTGEPMFFNGGPVSLDTALGLAASDSDPDGFRRIAGAVGVIDLDVPIGDLAPHLAAVRIYAGYSGWSPGQLDGELLEGAWAVVDSGDLVSEAFLCDPHDLWAATLRRAGGTLAWWVNCPADPTAN